MVPKPEYASAEEIAECLGVHVTVVRKRAQKEGWQFREENCRGGKRKLYFLSSLPAEIQTLLINNSESPVAAHILPALAPEAHLAAISKFYSDDLPAGFAATAPGNGNGTWDDPANALSPGDLEKVGPWIRIIQEAQNVPRGWKKRAWIENVALRHETTFQSIYRKIKVYEKKGLAGLLHRKATRGKPREWNDEALDFWCGLVLKKAHRKLAKDSLYDCLKIEAHKQGWQIGSYRSALWWLEQKLSPQLLALQRGGLRALDNSLPPVLRDYSDLAPLEILVGDQHRFDFWVVDEETGEVFRPECYLWQDLRTRLLYGAAIDHKYDSQLMGLALRIGTRAFGAFQNIYTDNGKPETSRYIMGIMKDMRELGLNREAEVDYPLDLSGVEAEDVTPAVALPGQHRRAIVRNAKAKMIEGTFRVLEGIMRDHFRLPGYVKNLRASAEEQDVDQAEAERLATQGKLPTFREFVLAAYRALDYYNREKSHRGVLREWAWAPKPAAATPMQCLEMCYNDGWRPAHLSDQAVDIVFLARPSRPRIVDRGRIAFNGNRYEADELVSLNNQQVDLRYDPIDPSWILVYYRNEFICQARPVEYSSMKMMELAERKIREKYERRSQFLADYRRMTGSVPDVREYSKVPAAEKVAAIVGTQKRKRLETEAELYRERSDEELAREVAQLETGSAQLEARPARPLPERPAYFLREYDRYRWCVEHELAGGELPAEDQAFKAQYEGTMDNDQREYWDAVRECGQA